MVKSSILTFLAVAGLGVGSPHLPLKQTSSFRTVNQKAFKTGEYLEYEASYGWMDAAKVTLEIQPQHKIVNNRPTFHIVGKGKTQGTFSWFFKVDDHYETFIDKDALVPHKFIRRVKEGGYELERDVIFHQNLDSAVVIQKGLNNVGYKTTHNTQDLLSAFYYARTLDLSSAKVGDIFTIQTFFDRENYPLRIKFLGRETIETSTGEFNCLKFRPLLQEGRVFKEEEDMTIWISDDQNKVPVRLKTDLLIGSMKMDLIACKNLQAPINGKWDD